MFSIEPVGHVESSLVDLDAAPRQGDEGGPDAWLVFEPAVLEALTGLTPGAQILVFTWLDQARRDVLRVYPRGDRSRPQEGVFATRSPHRPNPIGLHPVRVLEVGADRIRVSDLEAIHGTPIVDVKPVLGVVRDR
jgi:tRNA-Thr(GGU) m(6)t(6)A37 methyltransferase TsaA